MDYFEKYFTHCQKIKNKMLFRTLWMLMQCFIGSSFEYYITL